MALITPCTGMLQDSAPAAFQCLAVTWSSAISSGVSVSGMEMDCIHQPHLPVDVLGYFDGLMLLGSLMAPGSVQGSLFTKLQIQCLAWQEVYAIAA